MEWFSSYSISRPLTPPYMPFGIRRFLFWVPFDIIAEWYFHDVVFAYPNGSLHSLVAFGFRPLAAWAAVSLR